MHVGKFHSKLQVNKQWLCGGSSSRFSDVLNSVCRISRSQFSFRLARLIKLLYMRQTVLVLNFHGQQIRAYLLLHLEGQSYNWLHTQFQDGANYGRLSVLVLVVLSCFCCTFSFSICIHCLLMWNMFGFMYAPTNMEIPCKCNVLWQ